MKRLFSTRTVILCAVSVTVIAAAVVFALGGAQAVRGTVQLGLFPVVLLLLSALTLRGVRLPRVLVGLSAIGVLCGAIVRYSDVGLEPGAYGVARFDSDPLENATRIFRDRVRRFIGSKPLTTLGVIGLQIRSEAEARASLKERPQLGGIIWGSERWINISTALTGPFSLSSLAPSSFARARMQELGIQDLQLIVSVPGFGISGALDAATAEFVGRVVRASRDYPEALRDGAFSSEVELQLRSAAWMRARWTTSEHIAAAKWMLGTLYLVRAISGSEVEWGDLLCAEDALRSARIIVTKSGGNPALTSAVLNNQAVLQLLKATYSPKSDILESKAKGEIVKALNIKGRSRLATLEPEYWEPIVYNMKALGLPPPAAKKARR